MSDGISVILVVPCYNESERLDVQAFEGFVRDTPGASILFVNDGSSDSTGTLIDSLAAEHDRIHTLHLETNSGKAEAVRQGVMWCASGPYGAIGFWDADLSTPLDEVVRLTRPFAQSPQIDIVTAARIKMVGRNIDRNPFRHYSGRAFATAVSLLFGIEMYDTQCGAKLFRNTQSLSAIFGEPFITRWIFDVELLVRFSRLRGKAIDNNLVEVPLMTWKEVPGTKMRVTDFAKAPLELLRIHFAYFNRV